MPRIITKIPLKGKAKEGPREEVIGSVLKDGWGGIIGSS